MHRPHRIEFYTPDLFEMPCSSIHRPSIHPVAPQLHWISVSPKMALVRSWLTRWGNVVRRPASHRPRRSFHSEERDAPPGSFGTVERTILSASLRHVPAHGFSEAALVRGAQDVGYPDVSINLFPRGVFDLVLHHLVEEREALANRSAVVSEPAAECDAVYSGAEAAASPVRRRVARLTLNRLMSNQPIIHRWHEVRSYSSTYAYAHPPRRSLLTPVAEPFVGVVYHVAPDVPNRLPRRVGSALGPDLVRGRRYQLGLYLVYQTGQPRSHICQCR